MLWVIAGAGLLVVGVAGVPLSLAMAGLDPQLQTLILNLIYYLGFAALPVYLLARRRPGLWRAYRPYPVSFFTSLSIVALALLGVFFVLDLSLLWSVVLEAMGLRFSGGGFPLPSNAPGLALCVLSVAVLPAVCEEFVFRGAILSAFEREGTRRAVLLSALLFALLHGSIEGLPMQFLVGLILGFLVVCCDSIYAGLIYHTTHNAATILLQFAVSRGADTQTIEQAQAASTLEALGGSMGLMQLLFELLLMGAMILFALRIFRATAPLRGATFVPPQPRPRLRASEWALLALGLLFTCLLFAADIYAGLSLGGGA